jgi:hypothetical protein
MLVWKPVVVPADGFPIDETLKYEARYGSYYLRVNRISTGWIWTVVQRQQFIAAVQPTRICASSNEAIQAASLAWFQHLFGTGSPVEFAAEALELLEHLTAQRDDGRGFIRLSDDDWRRLDDALARGRALLGPASYRPVIDGKESIRVDVAGQAIDAIKAWEEQTYDLGDDAPARAAALPQPLPVRLEWVDWLSPDLLAAWSRFTPRERALLVRAVHDMHWRSVPHRYEHDE